MSIPTHKRNIPVTLDRAIVSRLDRIARECHLHRSSVLSGLIAEGLESMEARFERSPSDLRFKLGAAVYTLRRETARQRMWELIPKTQSCVAEARRQAEREVGLPAGMLDRPKREIRSRQDQRDQDARQKAFARPPPPAATGGASAGQHPVGAEKQRGGVESVDIDARTPQPADTPPVRGRRRSARGSDPQQEGNAAKPEVKATRKRPPRKRRRGPRRTALPRARQAYELRMLMGMGMGWHEIADEVGYSPANRGQSAKEMAKRYALRHGYQWPVR